MNKLTPFRFDNHIAHGAFVELDEGVAEMLGARPYDPAIRQLVGEAMAAMPLFATHTLFEGTINLQFQAGARRESDGETGRPLKLLVAQAVQKQGAALTIRGMAKAAPKVALPYAELMADGVLALMLEPADDSQPSRQAMVPIDGDALAESLEGYFAQSEQLPTLIRLVATGDKLAGFMLQRLPLEHAAATQDDWEHLATLAATITADELCKVPPETMMRRLFANEAWTLGEAKPVHVGCRCSREGISLLLISLGREEVDKIVAEQGQVEVTCEFCGRQYRYTRSDAATLFAAEGSTQSVLRH